MKNENSFYYYPIFLFFAGIIFVNSATAYIGTGGSINLISVKQAIAGFAGIVLYYLLSNMKIEVYRKYSFHFAVFGAFLILITFLFPEVNGAHRWVKMPFFNLQPSELFKVAAITSPLSKSTTTEAPPIAPNSSICSYKRLFKYS